MRKIKILLLLFILPAAGFTQKTATAVSIIVSINKNEPVNLTDAQVTDKKSVSTVVKAFEALQPLILFLNKALEV